MFLFSKKGSVLVLITIGVLLSLLVPSHAMTYYNCFAASCNEEKVGQMDCDPGTKFCVRRRLRADSVARGWIQGVGCGRDYHGTTIGCTPKKGPAHPEGAEVCLCDTDLCNTKDILTSGGGGGGTGGAQSGVSAVVLPPSRFGIFALSSFLLLIGNLSS